MPLSVRYHVDSTTANGFTARVVVTNNTASPIADWQIVITLYGDVVTSFANASGQFSDGSLVLKPDISGQVVAPHGGTLTVSFAAEGFRTTPVSCVFDSTACT